MYWIVSILVVIFSGVHLNAQEIIPFDLGEDNRIYVKGVINKSDSLDLVFDLGANITVINKTHIQSKKVNVTFDTIVVNQGSNGSSSESKSLNNHVVLGPYKRSGVDVLGISYPEGETLDGIIGWNFFAGKKVMINYERQQLVIYDQLPKFVRKYSKLKIKFISGLPYIQVVVYRGKKKVKVWAMLDTGYNSVLNINNPIVAKNKLLGQYPLIGESTTSGTDGQVTKADWVLLPKFSMGRFEIYLMPTNLVKTEVETHIPALLGGNLLKRFTWILDFERKCAYLQPNTIINNKF